MITPFGHAALDAILMFAIAQALTWFVGGDPASGTRAFIFGYAMLGVTLGHEAAQDRERRRAEQAAADVAGQQQP